jgi:methionyl-tRNA synthetase
MEKLEFSTALTAIWKFVGRANKYIDETTPWILARDEGKRARLATVLYNLAESLRIISVLIEPHMPTTPLKIHRQLGIVKKSDLHSWKSIQNWGTLPSGIMVAKGEPIFPRIDTAKEDKPENNGKKAEVKSDDHGVVTIDDFKRMDIRVAKVVHAERVPKADKLLRLEIEIGEEKRQIISGIADFYQPEDLIGKRIIVLANLKAAKIFGLESKGMLLAASFEDDSFLTLATTDREIASGYRLS